MVDADANRIVDLAYTAADGTVITDDELATMSFVVASNNYRAFGCSFAGTGSDHVVLELPDTNRNALSAYITVESQPNTTGGYDAMVDPTADYNWDFKTIDNATVALDIRFETQDSAVADQFVADNQQRKMVKLPKTADVVAGLAIYSIDLTTPVAAK